MMGLPASKSCTVVGKEPRMIYQGTMKCSYIEGKKYAAFFGIPYAAPPKGLERYEAPKSFIPVTPLDQSLPTYQADVMNGKISTQLVPPHFPGSSDCLYMNIFLPKDPKDIKELLPVLVFIHGGGFISGSNDPEEYTPDFIVQQGLVFVTINYRLGLFGFMNIDIGDKLYSGNTGLKDQVKALQWIQDNIACFKGDPNNVTISGCSAGGTCVNLHLISPLSKNLFHKAIVQSGGIYCPWGFKGDQRERNQILLRDAKFSWLFFSENEWKELQERTYFLTNNYHEKYCPESFSPVFGPTTENKYIEEPFITDNIEEMMKKADPNKPVMAGITKAEGLYQFRRNDPKRMYSSYVQNDQCFRQVFIDNFQWPASMVNFFFQIFRQRYFPFHPKLPRIKRDRQLANFIRDIQFHRFYDNFKFGPEKTLPKNFYVYRFDHVSKISAVRRHKITNVLDATHEDELKYLFTRKSLAEQMREEPYEVEEIEEVINHICSLWANFCKYGVPKSDYDSETEWRRHTEEKPCFLSINKDLKLIEEPLFKDEWGWLDAISRQRFRKRRRSSSCTE